MNVGDTIVGGRWGAAFAPQTVQSTVPITDLSQHVDGGSMVGTTGTNAGADKSLLHWEAGIVLGALALLWFMGAVALKSANN